MKEEVASNSFTKVAKAAIDSVNPQSETRKALQKVLMAANTRDISRQECFLIMLNQHDFVKFSSTLRYCSLTGGRQCGDSCGIA